MTDGQKVCVSLRADVEIIFFFLDSVMLKEALVTAAEGREFLLTL